MRGEQPLGRLHVAEIWRYPVKSLRGERVTSTPLNQDGMPGDRTVHIANHNGVLTGRTRHRLLTLAGTTDVGGAVLIDGHPWTGAPARELIRQAAGPDAYPIQYHGRERFDVLPLLVATDGAIAALNHDGRRLRPNIVIGGVPDLSEEDWPGKALRIGTAIIGMLRQRPRCVVTTIDPDTGAQDLNVLRRINREFGGALALDSWVVEPGTIRQGDPVELVDVDLPRPTAGGWIVGAPYDVPVPG